MSDLNFSLASGVKPMIREAANMNNDGGGGNLGYMRQRKKDKNQKRQYFDQSIFGEKKEVDIFGKSEELDFVVDDEGSFFDFVGNLFKKIAKAIAK